VVQQADVELCYRHSDNSQDPDIEKYAADSKEKQSFSLREWLHSIEEKSSPAQPYYKGKGLGVSWENLTVEGVETASLPCPTIPSMAGYEVWSPIEGALKTLGLEPFPPKTRTILQGFTGSARPGEMILVLGRPGSGELTPLKQEN
jgi:ATP-binding cassette, subfamily G (WHITE), member 2, SNQ2